MKVLNVTEKHKNNYLKPSSKKQKTKAPKLPQNKTTKKTTSEQEFNLHSAVHKISQSSCPCAKSEWVSLIISDQWHKTNIQKICNSPLKACHAVLLKVVQK